MNAGLAKGKRISRATARYRLTEWPWSAALVQMAPHKDLHALASVVAKKRLISRKEAA